MQSSLAGALTPQKLKTTTESICTPDQTFKFRLEDASPETEKVISYLRDLKQTTAPARRISKPQSLPFSVQEKTPTPTSSTTNKLTRVPPPNTKSPLGLFNITVCTCTCSNTSSPSKKTIKHTTKCIHPSSSKSSSSSPSLSSSLSSQKENIHPNNNRILKVPSTRPATTNRKPAPPPVIKKEDKMRKEGPNPLWDLQFQQVKVRQVKCEQVKMYPTHLPYALVYIFS